MIRLIPLGSGSKGNATLVHAGDTLVLVDCGFAMREIEARMAVAGYSPQDLSAVFVTHEHSDHVKGLGPFLRRYRLPLYLSNGSWQGLKDRRFEGVTCISPHQNFDVGDLQIEPFPVPHDAREPCQYKFVYRGKRVGIMTDIGHVTPHLLACAKACDGLLLESNHDPQMLRDGPYPWALQERIRNGYGHLSNEAAAALLGHLDLPKLQFVALGHLSESNNTPNTARQTCLIDELQLGSKLGVLEQHSVGVAMTVE
ncbi:MAG: MBL fold metallo-hydrolase [Granulosicoccaceae bacterium]